MPVMLAYIRTMGRGETDRLLTDLADRLIAQGLRLGGVVQSNTTCTDSQLCDMDVRVLPDGPLFRISQSLGAGSRGCRLDPAALEQAVGHVTQSLNTEVDRLPQLVIINKFGKHEADGRGFRPLIAEAMLAGVPVLTAVNATNQDAFQAFSGGMATCLPGQIDALLDWVGETCGPAVQRV
jgi:nucleoside-triphosphatase THEP1